MIITKKILFTALCIGLAACGTKPYKNTSLDFETRVEDLISRMTPVEKVNMLRYDCPGVPRLDIPAHNFWNECLHGVARAGRATVFPQSIGMAAMWDTNEMYSIANAISDEARAKHHDFANRGKFMQYMGLSYWTPNINIFRDPRWGRGMETYGEDPYLTAELAIPFIKGLQGNDPKYLKLISTAKHFAVHSGPESTRHSFDVMPNDYDMAETYLPHFKRAVQEAKVYSVMCAYQRLNGTPCCGNEYLSNLLRNEWGFEGYIVSDCWAIFDFYAKGHHETVNTADEAAAMAVKAGTDQNCGNTYPYLLSALKQGLITEKEIDVSVKRILLAMMRLGLFDKTEQIPYTDIPYSVVESEENVKLSLDAARKSIVMLKNDGLLPLSKNLKKVAVIGPNAEDFNVLLANYNGFPSTYKTPLTGIREKLPNAEVTFAQGCELAHGLPYFTTIPANHLFTDASLTKNGLQAAYTSNDKQVNITDANIDFIWGQNPPAENIDYDNFTAEWNGVLVPEITGQYILAAEAQQTFDLYINDSLLLSVKARHNPQRKHDTVELKAGEAYKIKVKYSQKNTQFAMARLLWSVPNPNMKQEAIDIAKKSDVVILCLGLSPSLEGEEMPVNIQGFSGGDRTDIELPATQKALIEEIYKLKKPTVLVLLNGGALALNRENEIMPAIIEAWYPGQQGGAAIADVLFGDYNPAGRLPVTFYKNIDDIPEFTDYNMQGKTYRYFKGTPLYEFGYGLSYSTFEYSITSVPQTIKAGDTVKITVEIKNTGKTDGDEVVQLYVSLPSGDSWKIPIRSLQGFKRINLKAGESKNVEFLLAPSQMVARRINNEEIIASGTMHVFVGGKQPDKKALANKQVAECKVIIK
ncbi:MAG: glycoside hydrolase family 3 C-terminal domain-containing protein [Prevotellaceae bacterium]|jgi:beta-glucosidase|nr:glycoside hydrolase family 3 C-terminal domain-containing protein [Prevotellaceae bacterium]